ncbi:MAG: hypothetical protein RIS64_1783 [Bacteroidota bacterium]|jgi:hypothetical protein
MTKQGERKVVFKKMRYLSMFHVEHLYSKVVKMATSTTFFLKKCAIFQCSTWNIVPQSCQDCNPIH